jgi:hypothetical protein
MGVFTDYLLQIERLKHRERIEEVLSWVFDRFPQLEPKIAWKQPMFTDHNTYIIGFSATKNHLAVAPENATMIRFAEEINKSGYSHTKELIRIPWDDPVDYELLEKMILFNISDKADTDTFWRK